MEMYKIVSNWTKDIKELNVTKTAVFERKHGKILKGLEY